ncbi:DUF600 family protein [Periweissella cryptocerci]|uniref:DUF600 family protein n=1 Tax=Periweissella cryptocerci TaxID=2506420 RepID=A0A4P6YST7_9LACO|nr:DUF600 family protein [Periweissella cryptocerci]
MRSNDILDIYNVSKAEYDNLIDNMDTILVKIYRVFIDNKQNPWDQIKMSLTPDGKFNVDFIYGALDNDITQDEREVIWAYEDLNIVPESCSDDEETLINCFGGPIPSKPKNER